jgi:hypothetical protein
MQVDPTFINNERYMRSRVTELICSEWQKKRASTKGTMRKQNTNGDGTSLEW